MCLRLLRTTQSLLRLVSRPLLIVQQTTQHRDESRAASVSTNAQTTFNHRNPGQISRLSCSQIGGGKKRERKSFVLSPKSERLLPPKHGPLACKWKTVLLKNARHSIFTQRVIYWLSISTLLCLFKSAAFTKSVGITRKKVFTSARREF